MKKFMFDVLIVCFLSLIIWNGNAQAGKLLFDDFSSGYLKGNKWWPREYVRHVENGKYIAKLGNSKGMGAEFKPGFFLLRLPFIDPDNVNTIQADITIVEAILDEQASDAMSFARIGGYFYNVNNTQEVTGDIFAELKIRDLGNGLGAYWRVEKSLSNDGSQIELLGSGIINLINPIQLNVPVNVKISYDGDKTFEFSVDGQTVTFVGQEEKKWGPQTSFKALMVGINATDGSDTGYISATFDNVYINNSSTIYDDFSAEKIDHLKWDEAEWVREILNGRLQSVYKASDSTGQVDTRLSTKDTPYFEATTRIESATQLSDGAIAVARLQGYFYNDSRGPGSGNSYNAYQGDIFVQVRLQYRSDGTLNAQAFVDRASEPDESSYTSLFSHTFATPISLDTDYVLSINFVKNKLIFKCNEESIVYTITTPMYPPYGEHRGLRSRLYLDSGEYGYLKTQFDNVYVGTSSLADAVTALKISSGIPWGANDIIPTDFDHNGKVGVPDAIASLQLAADLRQIVEHSSKIYTIQNGYPGNYAIAISGYEPYTLESVSGPNIVNFWQAHETHWLVNLSTRPSAGDIYNFQYHYLDDKVEGETYTISTVNDNFAFIASPLEGAAVNSDSFPITWLPAGGTVDHYMVIVISDTGDTIWASNFKSDTTSTTFNYDSTATAPLQPNKNYMIILHSYDGIGNQATTVSPFSFQ